MGKDKVFEFRELSSAYKAKKKDSPWLSGKDPELAMWKKTALKQLSKYLPKNEVLNLAIKWDNEESTIARPVYPKKLKAPDLSKFSAQTDSATLRIADSIVSTEIEK